MSLLSVFQAIFICELGNNNVLNLSCCSKVRVVSDCESVCFGNSLFNLKLHVSYWDIMAAVGDSSTCFVNSLFMQDWWLFCVCGLLVSPFPSLPNGSDIQEHVVLVHFNTGWAKEQFIYLPI